MIHAIDHDKLIEKAKQEALIALATVDPKDWPQEVIEIFLTAYEVGYINGFTYNLDLTIATIERYEENTIRPSAN